MTNNPNETFWLQLLCGSTAIGWGIYTYFMPEDLLDLPVYDIMSQRIADDAWVSISCGVGAAQTSIALASRRWPRSTRCLRITAAFANMLWWKIVAVSMFHSGRAGPMAMVACIIALFNAPTIITLVRRA